MVSRKMYEDLNVNAVGICKANRAWQHPHLQAEYNHADH
jgi:hypothetical protein